MYIYTYTHTHTDVYNGQVLCTPARFAIRGQPHLLLEADQHRAVEPRAVAEDLSFPRQLGRRAVARANVEAGGGKALGHLPPLVDPALSRAQPVLSLPRKVLKRGLEPELLLLRARGGSKPRRRRRCGPEEAARCRRRRGAAKEAAAHRPRRGRAKEPTSWCRSRCAKQPASGSGRRRSPKQAARHCWSRRGSKQAARRWCSRRRGTKQPARCRGRGRAKEAAAGWGGPKRVGSGCCSRRRPKQASRWGRGAAECAKHWFAPTVVGADLN